MPDPFGNPVGEYERARMVYLYEALEFTRAEIGALLGRHESTVQRNLNLMGVVPRRRGRKRGTQMVETAECVEAAALYRQGLSIKQVAARMGLDYTSARARILYGGARLRTRSEALKLRGHYRAEDHPRRADGPFVRRIDALPTQETE